MPETHPGADKITLALIAQKLEAVLEQLGKLSTAVEGLSDRQNTAELSRAAISSSLDAAWNEVRELKVKVKECEDDLDSMQGVKTTMKWLMGIASALIIAGLIGFFAYLFQAIGFGVLP